MTRFIVALGLATSMTVISAGGVLALGAQPGSQRDDIAAAKPGVVAPAPIRVAPYTKTNRHEPPVITPVEDPLRVAPFTKTNLIGCRLVPRDSLAVKPVLDCL